MGPDSQFEKAVERLYAASTGDERWETALDHVLNATGFDGAALYVYDRRFAKVDKNSTTLVRGLWHRLRTDCQRDYEDHYFRIDPRMNVVLQKPRTRILFDYLHTPEDQIDRHEYYAWYQKAQGTRYYLGGQSRPGESFWCGMTLHRRKASGHVDKSEIARFKILFDHFERAVAVDHRLNLGALPGKLVGDLVERSPTAIVLLDAQGEIVFCNAAARRVAALQDAVSIDRRRLRALRPCDNDRLNAAIRDAVNGGADPARGMFRVARRSGRRDYTVVVSPLQPAGSLFSAWAPSVCVLISDPDEVRELPRAAIQRLYGLTPAELRLCDHLLAGETVEELARNLDVAPATVRFHLASVFRKTGTNRQSDLVRLLLSIPLAAPSE